MLCKLQVADDLRAKQADHVGENRKLEAGEDFFGDAGSTHDGTAFQDQGLFPGPGQVSGVDQPVVACADDNRVVFRCHFQARFLGGLKNGSFTSRAFALRRVYSTVTSTSTSAPYPANSLSTLAMPIYFFSIGEKVWLVI